MTLTGGAEESLLLVSLYFLGKIGGGGGVGLKPPSPPAPPSLLDLSYFMQKSINRIRDLFLKNLLCTKPGLEKVFFPDWLHSEG